MSTTAAPETQTAAGSPAAAAPVAAQAVELLWPSDDQAEAAQMARRGVLLCNPGQAIARLRTPGPDHPPNPDQPSDPDQPPDPDAPALKLGDGVAWDATLSAYIATKTGHARLAENKLEVLESLEWTTDIDATHGLFHFGGDIVLRGGVHDLVELRGARDITVHECIEAASVYAGRDLTVHHGICGKEKGTVHAGGSITARFLTNARVIAGGKIVIANEIDNSHVQAGTEVHVEHGTILSGHIHAVTGIFCRIAGSNSGVKTVLELGVPAEHQAEIRRVSDASALKRQKAGDIRAIVEPLMARQKTLTAAQKEKATELLFMADEIEAEAETLAKKLAVLQHPLEDAMSGIVRIASSLHQGVIIRYPGHQACTVDSLRGPLTIKLLLHGTQPVIVAIDDHRSTKIMLQPL